MRPPGNVPPTCEAEMSGQMAHAVYVRETRLTQANQCLCGEQGCVYATSLTSDTRPTHQRVPLRCQAHQPQHRADALGARRGVRLGRQHHGGVKGGRLFGRHRRHKVVVLQVDG